MPSVLSGWKRFSNDEPTSLDDIELSNEIDMCERDSYGQRNKELDNILEDGSYHSPRHNQQQRASGISGSTVAKTMVCVATPVLLFLVIWSTITVKSEWFAAHSRGGTADSSDSVESVAKQQNDKNSSFFNAPSSLFTICATDNIKTDEGLALCSAACRLASCCQVEDPSENCLDYFPRMCSEYEICEKLITVPGYQQGKHPVPPPETPKGVSEVCTNTVNKDDWSQCEDVCAPAACCFQEDGGCGNEEWCMYYRKCEVLHIDIEDIVAHACLKEGTKDLEKCLDTCYPALCCFASTENGGCDADAWCMQYSKCDVIYETHEMGTVGDDVKKNVEDACLGVIDKERCEKVCLDGACCFADNDYGGCDKEFWCQEYDSCSILYDIYDSNAAIEP